MRLKPSKGFIFRAIKGVVLFIALILWLLSFRLIPDMKLRSMCRIAFAVAEDNLAPKGRTCGASYTVSNGGSFCNTGSCYTSEIQRIIWFRSPDEKCDRYKPGRRQCRFSEKYIGEPNELGWFVLSAELREVHTANGNSYSGQKRFSTIEKAVLDIQLQNKYIYPFAKPYKNTEQ